MSFNLVRHKIGQEEKEKLYSAIKEFKKEGSAPENISGFDIRKHKNSREKLNHFISAGYLVDFFEYILYLNRVNREISRIINVIDERIYLPSSESYFQEASTKEVPLFIYNNIAGTIFNSYDELVEAIDNAMASEPYSVFSNTGNGHDVDTVVSLNDLMSKDSAYSFMHLLVGRILQNHYVERAIPKQILESVGSIFNEIYSVSDSSRNISTFVVEEVFDLDSIVKEIIHSVELESLISRMSNALPVCSAVESIRNFDVQGKDIKYDVIKQYVTNLIFSIIPNYITEFSSLTQLLSGTHNGRTVNSRIQREIKDFIYGDKRSVFTANSFFSSCSYFHIAYTGLSGNTVVDSGGNQITQRDFEPLIMRIANAIVSHIKEGNPFGLELTTSMIEPSEVVSGVNTDDGAHSIGTVVSFVSNIDHDKLFKRFIKYSATRYSGYMKLSNTLIFYTRKVDDRNITTIRKNLYQIPNSSLNDALVTYVLSELKANDRYSLKDIVIAIIGYIYASKYGFQVDEKGQAVISDLFAIADRHFAKIKSKNTVGDRIESLFSSIGEHYSDAFEVFINTVSKLDGLFSRFTISDSIVGFRKNMSYLDHARAHIGSRVVASVDIAKFYDSITMKSLMENRVIYQNMITLFESVTGLKFDPDNFTDENIHNVIDGIFRVVNALFMLQFVFLSHNGVAPTGAHYSPSLSNNILIGVDIAIRDLLKQVSEHIRYTRYADDICISSLFDKDEDGNYIITIDTIRMIEEQVRKYGFYLKYDKTKIMGAKDKKSIAGVIIDHNNSRLSIGTTRKLELKEQYSGKSWDELTDHDKGVLAWVRDVNYDQFMFIVDGMTSIPESLKKRPDVEEGRPAGTGVNIKPIVNSRFIAPEKLLHACSYFGLFDRAEASRHMLISKINSRHGGTADPAVMLASVFDSFGIDSARTIEIMLKMRNMNRSIFDAAIEFSNSNALYAYNTGTEEIGVVEAL